MRTSDQEFNRLTALKKLRATEPVSRTDLANLSGLTGGTITAIVSDLVERGLVIEEKVASATRGRPKVNLRINPDGAFVVGTTLTTDGQLLAEISNLRGDSIFAYSEPLSQETRLDALARQFADVTASAIAASPVATSDISLVGLGLPAILDNRTGVVQFIEVFQGAPFPFAEAVEGQLGIPVRADNNINLLARAEHWFGVAAGVDDFTLIVLDLGMGGSWYRQGQLIVGSHGIGAELGHIKIVPENGRPCHCGGHGCLQAYSSISGIVQQACELAGEPGPPHYRMRKIFRELASRAKAGDTAIVQLFQRAGSYLGTGVANHINMQDPDRIIVLAREPELIELISDPFFGALHRDTLPALRDLAKVTFKQLDEQSYSHGAVAMVLEQLYQSR
jgi:predicted NBD/HSP70 family sugar kinase